MPTPCPTTAAPALEDSVAAASAHTALSTTSTPATSALPTSVASRKRKLGQFTESNWNHRCSEEQMLSDVSGRGAYTCTCRTGAALGNNLGCLSLIAFGRMKERRDINACLSNAERRDNMRRDLQSLRGPIFGTLRLRNVRARARLHIFVQSNTRKPV